MYVKKKLFRKIVKHLTARALELNNRKDRLGKAKQIREIYEILYLLEDQSKYFKSEAKSIFDQLDINLK